VRKLPEIVTEKKDKDKDREKEKERPRGRQLNNSEQHDKPQHRSGSREYGAYIIRLTPTLTKKKKIPADRRCNRSTAYRPIGDPAVRRNSHCTLLLSKTALYLFVSLQLRFHIRIHSHIQSSFTSASTFASTSAHSHKESYKYCTELTVSLRHRDRASAY
jgi:hypothetical protein